MSTVSSHPTPPPGFQMIILNLQQNLKNLDWEMQKNNWKVCVLFIRVASVYHDQQDSKQYQFILSSFFTALLSSCKMAVKKSEDVFVKLKKSTK